MPDYAARDDFDTISYRGKEVASWVNDLFHEAGLDRPTDDWKTFWEYYNGDQTWTGAQKGQCQVANYIGYIIERIVAEYARSNLAPVVEPVQDDIDEPLARAINMMAKKVLDRTRFPERLTLADMYSNVYGCAVWKTEWSNVAQDVVSTAYPPFDIFVDPGAREMHGPDGARYVIQVELMDVDVARRMYPGYPIVPDKEAGFGVEIYRFPWRDDDNLTGKRTAKMVLKKQAWIRDSDTKTYPFGRVITVIGNFRVDDRGNPYPWGLPFDMQYAKPPLGDIYGRSLIADLKPIQDTLNRRLEQLVSNENVMANPFIVTDDPQGVKSIESRTLGDVIQVRPGRSAKYMQWQGMPAGVYRSLDREIRLMEQISGINEISQGRQPGDVRSGTALSILNENMLALIRLKERFRLRAVMDVFKRLVKGVQLFYDPEEVFALVDPDLAMTVDWSTAQDEITREVNVNVRVEPTQEQQRAEQLETALALFDRQIIDREAVLDRLPSWADTDEILQRMERKEAEAAQMQAMQAGQQGGEVPQEQMPEQIPQAAPPNLLGYDETVWPEEAELTAPVEGAGAVPLTATPAAGAELPLLG